MKATIYDRLMRRELGTRSVYSSIGGMYGDRKWIKDLDIVNELDGHNGCVNALSWSKSGELLASGSDDTHINLHSYQSNDSTSPFKLRTSIATGHSANIFSVKFMPHSGDRTIISAAGDSQIRIFDIEYSGSSGLSSAAASTRAQGYISSGVQFLSEADTNTKVYRSHSDRVKKIVTESSPFLFLSCSEDGEVRQWDLRLPSTAYPKPRGGRSSWRSLPDTDDGSVPPALISYKRFGLDINSISCSPSQPHYIALGGAHLHCFLHDRRMLGRERPERLASRSPSANSDRDDDVMCEATQCVKRFAPNGQQKMRRTDNGHITACKISDANPNEMVVSWSGEWIYNFDLLRSPDAREATTTKSPGRRESHRSRHSHDRKRKRNKTGTSPLAEEGAQRAGSRQRTASQEDTEGDREMSLRVRYENGQSEDIRIEETSADALEAAQTPSVTEAESRSRRIADISVRLRKDMFDPGTPRAVSDTDPTGHATSFTSVLVFAASILDDCDAMMASWRYPVDPDEFEVAYQNDLRRHREAARRFVQASGVLARVLGGRMHTAGGNQSRTLDSFAQVVPAPNELPLEDPSELFCYDFLKAICLWLDSGPGAVVEGFTRPKSRYRGNSRFPIAEGAGIEALDDVLIPYLLELTCERPIIDFNTSRFESNESRHVFAFERAAVLAFAGALKIPFEDLSSAVVLSPATESSSSRLERMAGQDRKTALRFWAFRVGRGLLLNAGQDADHAFVDTAFGGLGRPNKAIRREERMLDRLLRDIDVGEHYTERMNEGTDGTADLEAEDEESDEDLLSEEEFLMAMEEVADNDDSEEDEDNEEDDNDDSSDHGPEYSDDEDDDIGEEDEEEQTTVERFLYRSAFERSVMREKVKTSVPCVTHTRYYRGHCNIKTVKDVNFLGPNDDYVVSGSDSGHLFIWNRATTELVNILEGDGETVNVIQGHPYEPLLAVSGIDHTIKIFSPDKRARRDARKGVGVAAADPAGWSSIDYGRRGAFGIRRRAQREMQTGVTSEPAMPRVDNAREPGEPDTDDTDTEPPPAPTGLSSKRRMSQEYEITARNDVDRQGGQRDAILSRAMLAQVAQRMRVAREAAGGGGGAGGGVEGIGGIGGAAAAMAGVGGLGVQAAAVGEAGVRLVVMGPDGPMQVDADQCAVM